MKKFILVFFFLFAITLNAISITTAVCPGAGCSDFDASGQSSVGIQVTGTFVGTLTFQGSVDGTNFVSLGVNSIAATDATKVTTATGVGAWRADVRGIKTVRVVFTAWTSGSAVVTVRFRQV